MALTAALITATPISAFQLKIEAGGPTEGPVPLADKEVAV